jgi:hypothetical protein
MVTSCGEVPVRLRQYVNNPCLLTLIYGAGFTSQERFAQAVNLRGWDMHGGWPRVPSKTWGSS